MKLEKLKYKVTRQGFPIVNSGYIIHKTQDLILFEIDMKTKNCLVGTVSKNGENTCLLITLPENSLSKEKYNWTELFFNYKGFEVFCSDCSRYTIRTCLVKK